MNRPTQILVVEDDRILRGKIREILLSAISGAVVMEASTCGECLDQIARHPVDIVIVDIRLTGDRESVFLGDRPVTAIHIPGHSPGSVAYLIESEGLRVLFAQDVHGPLDPSLLSDRAAYRRSLALIRDLDVDILCEGHYGVYRGRDEVRSFIASYL